MSEAQGGVIAAVERASPAARLGVRAGDRLVAINGHILSDVLDYRFYGAEEELELLVQRPGERPCTLNVHREYDEELGIEFEDVTFDGIRPCRNRCDFCFIQQMPPGMRRSLYVRDDDYRYSFLFGNYITLTNLTEDDWSRLTEQRLSPLYVSVHATDRALRARILGLDDAPDIVQQLRRLGEMGIRVETQIVVAPGVNDGAVLTQTIRDLGALYPQVHSIGVVPVGITRYQRCNVRPLTREEATAVRTQANALHDAYRQVHGVGIVYCSDELFLATGAPIPPRDYYDDMSQLENGIGLARQLLDDWDETREWAADTDWRGRSITLVSGTLIAPLLQQIAAELGRLTGGTLRVVVVENQFFGPTVTVSGLLTARDVVAALATQPRSDLVVLPRAMFDASGTVTLDDRSIQDVEQELGAPIGLATTLSDVIESDG